MRSKKRFYRKFDLDVSREEVERIVAEYSDPESYSHSPLAGPYTPPDTDALVGRTLAFRGEEKKSLLAFLPVKGWIMVTFFMCLGIALKHVPGVPTAFLASFYCGLGPALIVAGATFLARWVKEGKR